VLGVLCRNSSGCDTPTELFSLGAFAPIAPKKSTPIERRAAISTALAPAPPTCSGLVVYLDRNTHSRACPSFAIARCFSWNFLFITLVGAYSPQCR